MLKNSAIHTENFTKSVDIPLSLNKLFGVTTKTSFYLISCRRTFNYSKEHISFILNGLMQSDDPKWCLNNVSNVHL